MNRRKIRPYSDYVSLEAQGCNIGLMTCRICGVAILVAEDKALCGADAHTKWHDKLDGAASKLKEGKP